jgi:protein O-mannosyl-transferase
MDAEKNENTRPLVKPWLTLVQSNWPAITIIAVVALVYLNSFDGKFLFDDVTFLEEPSLRKLWPPWTAMFSQFGVSRPVVAISLAINYWLSGTATWSYHAFNLIVHILAALTLFGVVRRTLLSDHLRPRFGQSATVLSLCVALIWAIHPLQTESVTYIIQRAESMAGLMYLLTLYCFIRSLDSPRQRLWQAAAIVACVVGAGCKQTVVTAPVALLMWDYVFHSGSLRESLRRRWGLYCGLAASWVILALSVYASRQANLSTGFGFKGVSPWEYFKTQFGVVAYYLRLAVWPDPLCLDYDWHTAGTLSQFLPYMILIAALVSASVFGLYRRRAAGFAGCWFFLILAPTSTVMPIADLAAERRMYLPLAAVVAIAVVGGYELIALIFKNISESEAERQKLKRLVSMGLVAVTVAWLGSLTVRRNADYSSEMVMWADVVRKRPDNARAHSNLGLRLAERGDYDEALEHLSEAIHHNPAFVEAHVNLGMILANLGYGEQALPHFYEALRLRPDCKRAHFNIGQVLASRGRWSEAAEHYSQEIGIDPGNRDAHRMLSIALEEQKRQR